MKLKTEFYLKLTVKALTVSVLTAMCLYNLLHDSDACVKREYGTLYTSLDTADETDLIVNINTASSRDLQKLKGIGVEKARAIVAYRDEHGGFATIDELINVKGIGVKTLEKIRDNITV